MRTLCLYLLIIISIPVFGQESVDSGNGSDNMEILRSLSSSGDYQEAGKIAREILRENPNNTDIQLYQCRIYAWQSAYDSAFAALEPLLAEGPAQLEAIELKCDILYWKNDWDSLSAYSDMALIKMPGNESIMYYKALSEYQLGRRLDANIYLDELLALNPENINAKNLKQEILLNLDKPEVFVNYFYDHFNDPYSRRWHMITAGGIIPYSRGSISPYLNAGHLIDAGNTFIQSSAIQFNVDAYILLTRKFYMLAGYGISDGSYLAKHRGILNFWQVLPAGWSVSAGARYFYWDQHFLFYNLGVEKYLGNYWISLNNYLFFKDYGPSVSSYLSVRRYLEHKYNYIAATIGYGTSPDEPLTVVTDLDRLNAFSVRIGFMRQISNSIRISAGAGYMYEEYLDMQFRNRFEVRLGVNFKIN